uniref:Uncharacterized protein n=1 Tax=Arundo donax TaxID=35708 RepID=A0A0A9FM54_ARUDO
MSPKLQAQESTLYSSLPKKFHLCLKAIPKLCETTKNSPLHHFETEVLLSTATHMIWPAETNFTFTAAYH